MSTTRISFSLFDPVLVRPAIVESFAKLDPRVQWRNPVMFVVYVGSILTTILGIQALTGKGEAPAAFIIAVSIWLWFTVLFANFAEALAGSLAAKKRLPVTPGTLPTHGPLFVLLLIGSVVLVGLLNYVPALALGPIAEHFSLFSAK